MAWTLVPNLASLAASAYFIFLAHSAGTRHGGENYAALGLPVVGIPVLFVQAVVFPPLTAYYLKAPGSVAPSPAARWLFRCSCVPPVLTVVGSMVAILVGAIWS